MIDTNELRSQANVLVSWDFPSKSYSADLLNQAADTIDQQAERIKELKEALKYADRAARHGIVYDAEYVAEVLKGSTQN